MHRELLTDIAKSKYPKGTPYYNMMSGREVISSGKFSFEAKSPFMYHVYDEVRRDIVFRADLNEWAEHVKTD